MKKCLSEKIRHAFPSQKRRAFSKKGIVWILALSVLLLTLYGMTLPAVTMENEEDPTPEPTRSGTVYSSDLADFLTGVEIRDGSGNLIPPDGTVYLGENYAVSLAFSESNVSGQEKQFVYDENGYLTYQIPAFFDCAPVNGGTLLDASGNIVGSYDIDTSGFLRVRFIEGYIDSSKASVTITLNSTVTNTAGSGHHSIDFGGYTVEVNVSGAGQLDVQKTAGNYDARTHSIEYEVRVTARNGVVSGIVYTDTPTSPGLTVDPSSIVYTSLDGSQTYSSPPTQLNPREGFLVRYRAFLDPSLYQGINHISYRAKNTATVTGINEDGPISAQDSADKKISTYFLQKKGTDDSLNSRIHWTVTVGDGATIVDGLTITDLPGAGLSPDLTEGIMVTPYTYSSEGVLTAGTPFRIPFGADPSQIVLPTGMNAYGCVLTYFTNYTLAPGVLSQDFTNTVQTTDPLHGTVTVSATATGHAVGAPPDILKTVAKTDGGEALHYTVEINVPAFYAGAGSFYLTDSCTKITFAETEYFFGAAIDSIQVSTTDALGTVRTYLPYQSGSADYTYLFVPANNDPRVFYLGFNTAVADTRFSNWIETSDTLLKIEYDLPLDAPVYERPSSSTYVLSEKTLRDLVEESLSIKNRARLYYSETGLYVQSDAAYTEPMSEPFLKKGRVTPGGLIEYEVIFCNRDATNATLLQRKMKELIFHDELLTDGMSYVDGSLYCDIYNADLSRIRSVYRYDLPISANTELHASAADFKWYDGDNSSYTTLYEYAQHSLIGGSSSSTSRLRFRYQVQIDPDSSVFQTPDPTVLMQNRARLTGILPDDSPFDTGYTDCTVPYSLQMIQKDVLHTDGSKRADFIITLNPAGLDLVDEVSQMTVLDRMTPNLRPVFNTIRVFQRVAGVWEELNAQYTYDATENVLSFLLPDDVPLRITYTTIITETGDNINIGNEVELEGFAQYSAAVDAQFTVNDTGGAASSENFRFTLLKQSALDHRPLPGAVFALYGPIHAERQGTPPAGTPASVTVQGETLYYYASFTTGADGTSEIETNENGLALFSIQGLYALSEISAPEGYHKSDELIVFYAEEAPASALPGIAVLQSEAPVVAVNEPVTFLLPATGGIGVGGYYALVLFSGGAAVSAIAVAHSIRKKRRNARF